MVDLLITGAHPDDIELGFGAAAAKLSASGLEVAFLDLTNGEPTPFGDPQTRAIEAEASAEILGVQARITLDLPNRELEDTIEARQKVAEIYRRLQPKILFIQGGAHAPDAHPDHMAGAAVAWKARFDAKLTKSSIPGEPWYPNKVFYFVSSHLMTHVAPSFILDVSEFFETKLRAVRAYRSQFHATGREDEIIELLTRQGAYYGSLIGVDYGEPVIAAEPVGLANIGDLII